MVIILTLKKFKTWHYIVIVSDHLYNCNSVKKSPDISIISWCQYTLKKFHYHLLKYKVFWSHVYFVFSWFSFWHFIQFIIILVFQILPPILYLLAVMIHLELTRHLYYDFLLLANSPCEFGRQYVKSYSKFCYLLRKTAVISFRTLSLICYVFFSS